MAYAAHRKVARRTTARKKSAHKSRPKSTLSRLGKAAGFLALPIPDVELAIAAMANPDSGIKFVLGIAKKAGKRASEVQSVLFDKVKWTASTAHQWLKDHGFTGEGKDEGATFWRFRQQSPRKYKEFRTIVPGAQRNPHTTGLCRMGQHDKCPGVFHKMGGGGACDCPCHQENRITDQYSPMLGSPSGVTHRNPGPLKFGDRPYDLAQGETGRFHVVDEKGFIRWKTALGVKAYDHAGNLSDREPGLFQVIDTRDGSVYGAYRGGEDVPTEENPAGHRYFDPTSAMDQYHRLLATAGLNYDQDTDPALTRKLEIEAGAKAAEALRAIERGTYTEENSHTWPRIYKTLKAAKEAWYDSMPGRNDHAKYVKVKGGYKIVPEGRLPFGGPHLTTLDDMERGDTGFEEENPDPEVGHYVFIGGVRIGLGHANQILYASDWEKLWKLSAAGDQRLRRESYGPSTYGDTALFYTGQQNPANPNGLVRVTADEISNFKHSWPASGLPDGYDFYFDFASNGDLVDLWAQPEGTKFAPIGRNHKDTSRWDGDALVALSQDAQSGKLGAKVNPALHAGVPYTLHVPLPIVGKEYYAATGDSDKLAKVRYLGTAGDFDRYTIHRYLWLAGPKKGKEDQSYTQMFWKVPKTQAEKREILSVLTSYERDKLARGGYPGLSLKRLENPVLDLSWLAVGDTFAPDFGGGRLKSWAQLYRNSDGKELQVRVDDVLEFSTSTPLYRNTFFRQNVGIWATPAVPSRGRRRFVTDSRYSLVFEGVPGYSYGEKWRLRHMSHENPTPGEAIQSYDEHLETTTDPAFQAATPDEQAAAMTAQDLCENPSIQATILDYNYDAASNKTWAKVETQEFTEWFWISGQVPRDKVLAMLMPTIQRKLEEFDPPEKNPRPIVVGDKVKYTTKFLRSIGAYTGPMGHARGIVTDVSPMGGPGSSMLATINWMDGGELPERVNTYNLIQAGVPNPYYGPYTGFVVYNVENGVKVGTFHTQEEAQHWIDSYGATQEYKDRYYRIKPTEEFYAGTRYGKKNPSDLGQAAFDAGKDFRLSGAYSETGVANARVAKYGFSKWYNNHTKPQLKGHRKATLLKNWMEGWAAGKRVEKRGNPEGAAKSLYKEFHGKPPGEVLEVVTEKQEHEWLTQLGKLVELKVATITNLDATFTFSDPAPDLCSSEDGRQLYIEGGDQAIDLKAIKMDGDKWLKDSMALGVLYELTYGTEKGFHKFKLTDYYHKLGEETGVQPFLLYDPHNQLLSVSGGQYQVKDVGIVN